MAVKTNVSINGNDYFQIKRKVGVDDEGFPIFKKFYGHSKSEALQKYEEYKKSILDAPVASRSDSLGKIASYYTYQILSQEDLSPGTIALYERAFVRFLKPSKIYTRPIMDVTAPMIQQLLNHIAQRPDVSPGALASFGKYLKKFFAFANMSGYSQNLMLSVTVPKKRAASSRNAIQFFTEDEVRAILARPNRLHFLFTLAFSCGLRQGELLGLKYSDFSKDSLRVERQLASTIRVLPSGSKETVFQIQPVKTSSSVRTVPISEPIHKELIEHMKLHQAEMERIGYLTPFIFTTSSGNFIDKRNLQRAWKRHLSACKIPYRKFHATRATCCTLMCRKGVPLEIASRILGHSSVGVTAEYYRAVGAPELTSAAALMQDIFL